MNKLGVRGIIACRRSLSEVDISLLGTSSSIHKSWVQERDATASTRGT